MPIVEFSFREMLWGALENNILFEYILCIYNPICIFPLIQAYILVLLYFIFDLLVFL